MSLKVTSIADIRDIKNITNIVMHSKNDIEIFQIGDILPVKETVESQGTLDRNEVISDAKLKRLARMTPKKIKSTIDAEIIDLETAKDYIKTLSIAVSILARELLG